MPRENYIKFVKVYLPYRPYSSGYPSKTCSKVIFFHHSWSRKSQEGQELANYVCDLDFAFAFTLQENVNGTQVAASLAETRSRLTLTREGFPEE